MKLYQYKGGCYDGCFWEWNFFMIHNRKFINLFSSGLHGVDTKEKVQNIIENSEHDNDIYVYDLRRKNDIKDFEQSNSSNNVGFICDKVNTILKKEIMFFHCSYCGKKVYPINNGDYPSYFHDENNYSGNGGIGIAYHSCICEDCYFNRCDRCGSIIEDNEKATLTDDEKLCEYCSEENEETEED
jgi:hypothetical protein